MNLRELSEKYNIRRIDFEKVHEVEAEEEYSSDELICPYCGEDNQFDSEEIDDILGGTAWQCCKCGKWFFAEGELSVSTTCTAIENKVLEPFTRREIEETYKHMDKCAEGGVEWNSPFGVVEYTTYKIYAEPLFENMEGGE